jgi:hypothetical protein
MVATPAVEVLRRVLESGARVIWEERVIRGPRWAITLLAEEPEAKRAIMRRAETFRAQLRERGQELPSLRMSDAQSIRTDSCYSCGESNTRGGRCMLCLVAVYVALDLVPPRDVWAMMEEAEPLISSR